MIKCTVCENHQQKGSIHKCSKCDTKIVYGIIQEQFIESCSFFRMNEKEKKRRAYYKRINNLPIDDRECGGKHK